MNISHYSSANQGSRCGHVPDVIVCHITDGAYEGAVETLCGRDGSKVSSNFVVGRAGQIAQLVDVRNEAWCNGTQCSNPGGARYVGRATASIVKQRRVNANLYTVSIECEGNDSTHGILTNAQFNSLVWLIQYIRQQVHIYYGVMIPFNRDHIIGHCEITPKEKPDCPGRDFPFTRLIEALGELPPLTQIDEPGGIVGGSFLVRGWALNKSDIDRVDIYADGARGLGSVRQFHPRPDVAAVHGTYPGARNCEYRFIVPVGTLSKGSHTIDVAGIGKDKTVQWSTVHITVK